MKLNYLFIFFLLSLLLSCNVRDNVGNSMKDDFKTLTIDPFKGTVRNYSQFIDSIRYIPLETPSDVLLNGSILKVIFIANRFFVFDENKVTEFDSYGKYILKVGKKGRGPREILNPTDFIVDTLSKTIEILSRVDEKIISYNLYNGQFNYVCQVKGISAEKLCKPKLNTYILYGKDITSMENNTKTINTLFFYNRTNNRIIKSTLPIPYYLARFNGTSYNNFSSVREGVLFLRLLDNNIYLIDNSDQIRVKYKIDFGDYNIPEDEKFYKKYKYLADIIQNTDYAVHFTGILASDTHLYFLFMVHNKDYIVIYDRVHDKILYGNLYKINNDLDSGPVIFPLGISGNCLISIIEPPYFISHFKKLKKDVGAEQWDKYLSNHPNIRNIINSLKPENNPIIGLYYLKNDFLYESNK